MKIPEGYKECPDCFGAGTVEVQIECPRCHGTGMKNGDICCGGVDEVDRLNKLIQKVQATG